VGSVGGAVVGGAVVASYPAQAESKGKAINVKTSKPTINLFLIFPLLFQWATLDIHLYHFKPLCQFLATSFLSATGFRTLPKLQAFVSYARVENQATC
jgi:hypothetical protein